MPEVPRQKTPASEAELATALVRSHAIAFGELPSRRRATLMLCQWLIETGRGTAIFNNNVGNLTANNEAQQDFWRPPWFHPPPYDESDTSGFGSNAAKRLEVLHNRMNAGKAPRAFRSYDDLEAGALSYMRLIKDRYPGVLKAASNGSARQFATAVFEEGYCPDPECHPDKTTPSFESLQKEINRKKLFANLPNGGAGGGFGLALILAPLVVWGGLQLMKGKK